MKISGLLVHGLAEKREARPKVALLDNFDGPHGAMTESVLLSPGGLQEAEVQRYFCGSGNSVAAEEIFEAPPEKLRGLLRRHIGEAGNLLLEATSLNLRQILQEQPEVRVISQSQSQCPIRVALPFYEKAQTDAAFREKLARTLLLPPEATAVEVGDELFSTAETILREETREARKEYLGLERELNQKGVVHLLPAGNLGELSAQLEKAGHQLSPSGFRSILCNDFTTVVGSLDEQGQPASFNSPRSGTEVWAPGVNIEVADAEGNKSVSQGTSLSVPLVARQVVSMLDQHPQWGSFEVEAELKGELAERVRLGEEKPVPGGTLKGDGQLDDFVLGQVGSGLLSGIHDESVGQFVQAEGKSFRLVLAGEKPDVAQVVDCRENGEGQRKFVLETHFGASQHIVRAEWTDGAWNPQRTVEEFHSPKS